MPVSFTFVPGTTREQARALLHRIGEIVDVEAFTEIDLANVAVGQQTPILVIERSGDTPAEDERARQDIAATLGKSPHVWTIDTKGEA
jgi:hypothetical protein